MSRNFSICLLFVIMFWSNSVEAENLTYNLASKSLDPSSTLVKGIKSLSDFVIDADNHGVRNTYHSSSPLNHIFNSVIEENFSDGTFISNILVMESGVSKVDGFWQNIYFVNKNTLELTKTTFNDWEYVGSLNKNISYFKKKNLDAYLMPIENGTIVIKQEVAYDVDVR